mmetsp:Transcript_72614/g.216758  ORF Transcript_72614/g.216758 Transcript_72614/m.216758 type:complete len:322 (+) Transcript_72614:946-1911(+)
MEGTPGGRGERGPAGRVAPHRPRAGPAPRGDPRRTASSPRRARARPWPKGLGVRAAVGRRRARPRGADGARAAPLRGGRAQGGYQPQARPVRPLRVRRRPHGGRLPRRGRRGRGARRRGGGVRGGGGEVPVGRRPNVAAVPGRPGPPGRRIGRQGPEQAGAGQGRRRHAAGPLRCGPGRLGRDRRHRPRGVHRSAGRHPAGENPGIGARWLLGRARPDGPAAGGHGRDGHRGGRARAACGLSRALPRRRERKARGALALGGPDSRPLLHWRIQGRQGGASDGAAGVARAVVLLHGVGLSSFAFPPFSIRRALPPLPSRESQ